VPRGVHGPHRRQRARHLQGTVGEREIEVLHVLARQEDVPHRATHEECLTGRAEEPKHLEEHTLVALGKRSQRDDRRRSLLLPR